MQVETYSLLKFSAGSLGYLNLKFRRMSDVSLIFRLSDSETGNNIAVSEIRKKDELFDQVLTMRWGEHALKFSDE